MVQGVRFLVDGTGRRDGPSRSNSKSHARLWEDFYDRTLADQRASEPRESLESVKKRILGRARHGVAEYSVVFARSARRELERLEAEVARRIISRVEALAADPRPQGCRKAPGSGRPVANLVSATIASRSMTTRA